MQALANALVNLAIFMSEHHSRNIRLVNTHSLAVRRLANTSAPFHRIIDESLLGKAPPFRARVDCIFVGKVGDVGYQWLVA